MIDKLIGDSVLHAPAWLEECMANNKVSAIIALVMDEEGNTTWRTFGEMDDAHLAYAGAILTQEAVRED